MSNRHPQMLILTVAVATSLINASRAACEPTSTVPFELDEHGGIIVPVTIGSVGPFRFILDTGASGTSISEKLVAQLDAPIVAKTDLTTPAGRNTVFVAALRDVRLGVMSSEKILAVTVPASALSAAAGAGIVGMLGQDFLGAHNYTLDYRHRTLTWDGEDPPTTTSGRETTLRLMPRNGQLLVELPQPDASTVQMVPDSGAAELVLFGRPHTRLPITNVPGVMQLSGMAGARFASAAVVPQLKVGSITLHDQAAVAVTLDADDPHTGDGLLPLHEFASVSFHASGYIVFRR